MVVVRSDVKLGGKADGVQFFEVWSHDKLTLSVSTAGKHEAITKNALFDTLKWYGRQHRNIGLP